MNEIIKLMSTILMVPNRVNGTYRPVKNTSKNDCYNVLGQLQDILRTNTSFPRNLEAEIRKPLEYEIERLKKENKQLLQNLNRKGGGVVEVKHNGVD